MDYRMREAGIGDIDQITRIYNQGIEDRVATLEASLKSVDEMKDWLTNRSDRHKVLVIEDCSGTVMGWASINTFNSRCCCSGVADMSIYIEREQRGKGLGKTLLSYLIKVARENGFHKLVLSAFEFNEAGIRLYRSAGFREVGTYINHGILDGEYVNVAIMEKLL